MAKKYIICPVCRDNFNEVHFYKEGKERKLSWQEKDRELLKNKDYLIEVTNGFAGYHYHNFDLHSFNCPECESWESINGELKICEKCHTDFSRQWNYVLLYRLIHITHRLGIEIKEKELNRKKLTTAIEVIFLIIFVIILTMSSF